MIDPQFLKELDRFSLIVRKRVTSKYSGERKSLSMGKGIVLKDHRMYAIGDDLRSVDWKIYGRTDHLHVKRYEEERSLVVHTIVDSSKSMDFGSPLKKFDYAAMLGVGFSYLATKNNEKFRFSTFSDDLELFQPKRGMAHLAAMIDHLNSRKLAGQSLFSKAMLKYKKTLGSRSFIVLISDFLFDIDDIREGLFAFKNQDINVVQVLDKSEVDLDLEGDFKLQDSESGEEFRTAITPRAKQQYRSQLQEHISQIKKACSEIKANFVSVHTQQPVFDVFWNILK
ncbi:DUF58 domain-containing protein [Candidatus Woesearchaeota archaeon]|nr:DUF58 domain-containing protein [Candidatus Woesearchaeota archaeon]